MGQRRYLHCAVSVLDQRSTSWQSANPYVAIPDRLLVILQHERAIRLRRFVSRECAVHRSSHQLPAVVHEHAVEEQRDIRR